MKKSVKLRQAQVWRQGEKFLRIVRLERLEVEYKSTTTLTAKKGDHHKVSKKEFCRLLKNASLLAPAETLAAHPPSNLPTEQLGALRGDASNQLGQLHG